MYAIRSYYEYKVSENNKDQEIMETPLIGISDSIERIRELIKHIADTDLNVLITGESGVGKEVVAQNLYLESQRKGVITSYSIHYTKLYDPVK